MPIYISLFIPMVPFTFIFEDFFLSQRQKEKSKSNQSNDTDSIKKKMRLRSFGTTKIGQKLVN